MTASYLFGSLVFGALGFAVFIYGKKESRPVTMTLGAVLLLTSYLIGLSFWFYAVGIGALIALFYFRQ